MGFLRGSGDTGLDASCGPRAVGTPRDRNFITTEELRASGRADAYAAVEALRPLWLRSPGPSSIALGRQSVQVYLDGSLMGELGQLSNPARVNFPSVLDSTSEMKKLKALGVDPSSPRGIQLRTAAVDRVAQACDAVRRELGHCSVWKAIRHRDGRQIPDITQKALALL